jgi:triacylglycerol lipase
MPKILPPARFRKIRPPNANYTYFEDKNKNGHQFIPDAGFALSNASWLSEFAMLAYGNETFIRDKFNRFGLTADGFDLKFFDKDTTQCFVTRNDKIVVLSFRGTEIDNFWGAFEDWRRNLELLPEPDDSGGGVHKGFQKDLKAVWEKVRDYVRPLLEDCSGRRLWITGHSLGAALATLAAERAVRDAQFRVQGVYVYGSPRVGDEQFKQIYAARGLDRLHYRFVYNVDVVAKIPPGAAYRHVGQLKWIDTDGHLHDEMPDDAENLEELPARFGRRSCALLKNILGFTIPAPFANHAPIYYASHLWNNLP